MYVKILDGKVAAYPYSANDLKADNPNVSFPVELTDEILADFSAAIVHENPVPAIDHTKNVVEANPEFTGTFWQQAWAVTDASAEEIAEREAGQWDEVRRERNARLAACDWTQLDDTPLANTEKQAWAAYRQALRDITAQPDPFAITWPNEPGA